MWFTFAKFVAVLVALASAWLLVANLVAVSYEPLVFAWIVASGVVGLAGGVAYLMSFDGPVVMRTRQVRFGAWLAMLLASLLPTSLRIVTVPLVLVVGPTLLQTPPMPEEQEPVTSG